MNGTNTLCGDQLETSTSPPPPPGKARASELLKILSLKFPPPRAKMVFKCPMNEGVVSKETVVLRRWGSSIQKFGFINGVDNVNWPPYRDSKS